MVCTQTHAQAYIAADSFHSRPAASAGRSTQSPGGSKAGCRQDGARFISKAVLVDSENTRKGSETTRKAA